MVDLWTTLGLLEPTKDIRTIKKAYAKKLRVTRPDADPEGFMALRAALERAMSYARNASDGELALPVEAMNAPVSSDTQTQITFDASANTKAPDESEENDDISAAAVMHEVESLLKDPFKRNDPAIWVSIFDDERLESIDSAIDFEVMFRDYLLELLGYFEGNTALHNSNREPKLFSTRMGTRIFDRMGWRDSENRPLYIQDQIDWLRRDLDVLNKSSPTPPINTGQQHTNLDDDETDVSPWKIAIGLVVIVQIFRLLFDKVG